jgi:hypothetical protein
MNQASHVLLGIHDVYNKEFCHGDLPSSGIVQVVSCACLPFLFMLFCTVSQKVVNSFSLLLPSLLHMTIISCFPCPS